MREARLDTALKQVLPQSVNKIWCKKNFILLAFTYIYKKILLSIFSVCPKFVKFFSSKIGRDFCKSSFKFFTKGKQKQNSNAREVNLIKKMVIRDLKNAGLEVLGSM